MSYRIHIPYRSRSDSLIDVACSVHELADSEDRAVTQSLAMDAYLEDGLRTAGELIDRIEQADPAERRRLLDRSRIAAGLDSVADVIARQRFLQANDAAHRRAAARPVPSCAVCGVHPTGPGGMPEQVPPARRWHCREHEHPAEPGDMDRPPLPIDFATMREIDPDEDAREQAEDERRRNQREREMVDRRAEAEAIRRARERYDQAHADDPYVNPLNGPGWAGIT